MDKQNVSRMTYNFFSLGWACSTAGSMARYGLRSESGPFDWYQTELPTVIHFIDTEFVDFLQYDNLCSMDANVFKDNKYNLIFTHDVKNNFENEYKTIYSKYKRRIERFKEAAQKGMCCIRACKNDEEIKWIVSNHRYIDDVIKRKNTINRIVFLIPYYMTIPSDFPFEYYVLQISVYQGVGRYALRRLFETNQKFIDYCISNIDEDVRKSNLIYELQSEIAKMENENSYIKREQLLVERFDEACGKLQVSERRLRQLLRYFDFNKINMPSKIVIYGTDWLAKWLCDKVIDKCEVVAFLCDECSNQKEYHGIPILNSISKLNMSNATIILTSAFGHDVIMKKLKHEYDEGLHIIFFEELLFTCHRV